MAKNSMDLLELLRKRGDDADVDFLREALKVVVQAIMDAEVSAQIGAEHGERSASPIPMVTDLGGGTPEWGAWNWASRS